MNQTRIISEQEVYFINYFRFGVKETGYLGTTKNSDEYFRR